MGCPSGSPIPAGVPRDSCPCRRTPGSRRSRRGRAPMYRSGPPRTSPAVPRPRPPRCRSREDAAVCRACCPTRRADDCRRDSAPNCRGAGRRTRAMSARSYCWGDRCRSRSGCPCHVDLVDDLPDGMKYLNDDHGGVLIGLNTVQWTELDQGNCMAPGDKIVINMDAEIVGTVIGDLVNNVSVIAIPLGGGTPVMDSSTAEVKADPVAIYHNQDLG